MNVIDTTARSLAMSPEAMRRIFVTLAALLVFTLCAFVPMPGVSMATLAGLSDLGRGALARFSIMGLGIIPWISATTLAEIAVLVLPLRITTSFARDGHADPFSPLVVGAALVLAAFQAYGVAVAMEAMSALVPEPSLHFRAGVVATLIGGSAIGMLLAGIITRHGIGRGFWVLWATVALSQTSIDWRQVVETYWLGMISPAAALTVFAGTTAAIAAVVFLVLARRNLGAKSAVPLIWPIFVYAAVVPWIGVAFEIFGVGSLGAEQTLQFLMPHSPLGACVAAITMLAVTMRYGRRHGTLASAPLEAAALIAIMVGSQAAIHWTGFPIPGGGSLVVLATVATVLLLDGSTCFKGRIDTPDQARTGHSP